MSVCENYKEVEKRVEEACKRAGRKRAPNGKAEISLKVDDMFNSWVPKDLNLQYKTQDLHMRMIPDSRRVSLSFIYKFGDFKAKEHKEVDSSRFGK